MDEKSSDILTLISKEKFRRKLLISSRIIAILLVIALIWIGFVQMHYAKEVNKIKTKYGSLGYCYLCGLESGRSCGCSYYPDLMIGQGNFDRESLLKNIALENMEPCPNMNNKLRDMYNKSSNSLNFSSLNFS